MANAIIATKGLGANTRAARIEMATDFGKPEPATMCVATKVQT